jgi:hypothetical protein
MSDPTYITAEIEANPIWRAAFVMSEHLNDNAPIGWSRYIPVAESLARQAPLAREPASLPEEELSILRACIEGIAIEEMQEWKRVGLHHAFPYAKQIAERALKTWLEPAPQDTREAPASTEEG